jgi:hypothetical protein
LGKGLCRVDLGAVQQGLKLAFERGIAKRGSREKAGHKSGKGQTHWYSRHFILQFNGQDGHGSIVFQRIAMI